MDDEENYSTIRQFLGDIIGQRVVDVTQHDIQDWEETGSGVVYLHFENGMTLRFEYTCSDCSFELEKNGKDT
jgi:hypothetical protein